MVRHQVGKQDKKHSGSKVPGWASQRSSLKVRETTADPVVKVEAQSLAEEIGSYCFSVCTVIWYDILNRIQHVSKLMQSDSMQLDVAFDLLEKTRDSPHLLQKHWIF